MKIIHFASGDLWAGAEVQLYHLACSLVLHPDIQLMVILLNFGQLERKLLDENINVVVIDESELNGFRIFLELKKVTNKFKPDIIHTHRIKENLLGGIVAGISGCKSVRTVHGASEHLNVNIKNKILSTIDIIVGRFFQQKIIAVSFELKCKLVKYYSPSKLTVINNCVNVDYIHGMSHENIDLTFDIKQLKVCFIGRFVSVKRVDLFYDLAKEIIDQNHDLNIHFYMIGDGPLWEKINNRVCLDGYESRIHLTGFIDNTAPYLKDMDLLLFTSDHEGLPMTLLEAMVLGVPVLARNELTTIRDVLCNGKCGYIELSNDISIFGQRIVNILSNETDRINKSLLAKSKVSREFSIKTNVRHYIHLYKDVLNEYC